jgi:putative membrane protein
MSAMNKVAQVLAALEALTLIAVGVMEAFFYRSPELYAIFLIQPGEYDAVRLWTVNVGFYNIFMGIGLIVALAFVNRGRVEAGRTIVLYTSALHVLLGITLVISDRRTRAEAAPVGGA